MAATSSVPFQIALDSEKENPHTNMPLKEKTHAKSHVLQPLGAAAGGIKQQGRGNFAVLKSTNTRTANNGKVAFRDVGNVKAKDDNIQPTNTTLAGGKKSTVIPVEQFKSFSVYEDRTENDENQQQQVIFNDENTQDFVDKENKFAQQQQHLRQQHILTERSDIHKYHEEHYHQEYSLDTTPMSVSEVLSPMSVDRSANVSQIFDDSNSKEIAEENVSTSEKRQQQQDQIPRNDRQRFFEVIEYQHCILEYFRESEKKHRPKPHYMRRQTDINYSMRTILVDWLVEVSEEYKLDTETLYLSVSYIDRFLSHMSVVRNKLQLVGTAAMYIASKYEEIYPPDVAEFVFITDDTYNKAQVLRMEQIILKILAFDLCTPTAYVFINTYCVLMDIPEKVKFLTLFICELSLLEADPFLRFHPSLISSASLALARYICRMPIWSEELVEITTYRLEDLKEVFLCLCKSHNAAVNLPQQAIQEKYKAEKFLEVSNIEAVQVNEEQFEEILQKYTDEEQQRLKEQKEASLATVATTEKSAAAKNLFFKF